MRICCFIGHGNIDEFGIDQKVTEAVERMVQSGFTDFLSGGMGAFDRMGSCAVYRLKKVYPHIQNILVIPYMNFRVFDEKLFDQIIYPELENYFFKKAIVMRNRYMVDQSEAAICYIKNQYGGAIQTYRYAEKRGKVLLNLADK